MPNGYTPFRLDFPGFALIDALSVIKNGAATTPAGRVQLAHSAFDLTSWALHATLEKNGAGNYSGTGATYTATAPVDELSDDDAQRLLEQLCIASTSDVDDDGTHMMAGCPISPATALKLAGWLLKAASIVLPVIL